jgi:hypothetical protein
MEALDALPPAQIEQFLDGPALKPPPGVVSNFSDAPNRTALCVGITITCIVLVTLGAIIRLYTRIFCMKKMRLEDCMCVTIFLCSLDQIKSNKIRSYDCSIGLYHVIPGIDYFLT